VQPQSLGQGPWLQDHQSKPARFVMSTSDQARPRPMPAWGALPWGRSNGKATWPSGPDDGVAAWASGEWSHNFRGRLTHGTPETTDSDLVLGGLLYPLSYRGGASRIGPAHSLRLHA
jgi:hypothetical protein